MLATFTPREAQNIQSSTREAYDAFIEAQIKADRNTDYAGLAVHDVEPLDTDHESAILWLGDRKTASKVVLFIHGGGYILPALPGHIRWPWDAYVMEGRDIGINVACGILQYGLTPDCAQPNQLQQALSALQSILRQGFKPSDIIIGGDSAGGHLTMLLLLHLHDPHCEFQSISMPDVKLDEPLLGAFHVSPFLSTHTALRQDISVPLLCDMLSMSVAKKLININAPLDLATGSTANNLASFMPLDGDSSRFNQLDKLTRAVYITYGEYELIASHSIQLADIIRKRCKGVKVESRMEPKGPHDTILLEYSGPKYKGGPASNAMKQWVRGMWKPQEEA